MELRRFVCSAVGDAISLVHWYRYGCRRHLVIERVEVTGYPESWLARLTAKAKARSAAAARSASTGQAVDDDEIPGAGPLLYVTRDRRVCSCLRSEHSFPLMSMCAVYRPVSMNVFERLELRVSTARPWVFALHR